MADGTIIFDTELNSDGLSSGLGKLSEKSQSELGKLSEKVNKELGESLKQIGEEAKARALSVTTDATNAEKKYESEKERIENKRKNSDQLYLDFLRDNVKKIRYLREEELKCLEASYELGIISTEEYFSSLENYRDRYFSKGSAEWIDYTVEILEHNKKLADEQEKALLNAAETTADDIKSVFVTLEKERESLSKKMQNLPIYKNNKFKNGDETVEFISLADIERQNELLEQYLHYMSEAQAKISSYWRTDTDDEALNEKNAALKSDYFSQMRDMPIEDALDFARALLGNTEEKFYEHLGAFAERKTLSDQIARALFSEETADAADSAARNLGENFTDALTEELSSLSGKFFSSGESACESFGEGFMATLDRVLSSLSSRISAGVSSLGYGGLLSGGDTNNIENNTSYNIYGSSTPTETIRLMREKEQMKKMMLE